MKLAELLDLHRAHYLDHFAASLEQVENRHFSEALVELSNYAPNKLYQLYRPDHLKVVKGEYRIVEFQLDRPFEHAPFQERRGDCLIEVLPFEWNRCIIQVLCERFDREALETWAHHWMDTEDSRPRDAEGFQNAIHHISPPSYPLGKLTFSIDFGTAPVRAVMELIQIFALEKGTTRVTLGAVLNEK
jgi:hypothetical protein